MARPEFADVYREHLPAVWRYVRSRISDYHDAQDVTSDVFVRAWRAWGRYDAARSPGPWLFGIAQRAVVDWFRRSKAPPLVEELEEAMSSAGSDPEEVVLSDEMLARLRTALSALQERERDALALRFAAGLKMAEIGQVLGISEGATKMMLSRAVAKLAEGVSIDELVTSAATDATVLDEIVEGVLSRSHSLLPEDQLRKMVLHLAVMHDAPVPKDLPNRVAACVECAQTVAAASNDPKQYTRLQRLLARVGIAPFMGFGWALLAPVCVVCTLPVLAPVFLAVGFTFTNTIFWIHNIGLASAPVVFFLVYRHFRRHRDVLPLSVVGLGAVLLAGHIVLHHVADGSVAFDYTNRIGDSLLLVGTLLNWRALSRWTSRQFSLMKAVPQPAF